MYGDTCAHAYRITRASAHTVLRLWSWNIDDMCACQSMCDDTYVCKHAREFTGAFERTHDGTFLCKHTRNGSIVHKHTHVCTCASGHTQWFEYAQVQMCECENKKKRHHIMMMQILLQKI